jgi:CRISPR-associated protein Csx10
MTRTNLTLRVATESDWHVGTGAGRAGGVDRVVARDTDGLPYVPAKTLTGIWRDGCERLVRGLNGGQEHGPWTPWLEYLFGSQPALAVGAVISAPRPAALAVRSAHLPKELRDGLLKNTASAELLTALTFVKVGVSIDPESGRAKEKFLRFEEMARAGAILETSDCVVDLPDDPDARAACLALLVAGAALVERFAGKRRRGAGRCRFEVVGNLLAGAIEWIERHPDPPHLRPPEPLDLRGITTEGAADRASAGEGPAEDGWRELELTITTLSPLSVPKRVVGNVGETLDFLPGHHLLPIVSRSLVRAGADPAVLFGNADVIVMPATIVVGGARGRPVPLALEAPKRGAAEAGRVVNQLRRPPDDVLEQIGPRKQIRSGYVGPTVHDTAPRPTPVGSVVRTHNSVADGPQRPTERIGGVYTYEAIRPDTVLRSAIRIRQGVYQRLLTNAGRWWEDIEGEHALGRSRKDDYGRVKIRVKEAPAGAGASVQRSTPEPETLVVWCLSDVILQNEELRPDTSAEAFAQALGVALGATLRRVDGRVFLAPRRFDSWHGRWGLPRGSLVAVAAGSCVELGVSDGPLDDRKLRDVEMSGIGLRRGEGFGQVCFNDPLLMEDISSWKPAVDESGAFGSTAGDTTPAPPIPAESPHADYARLIEREAWRARIVAQARAQGAKAEFRQSKLGWSRGEPGASQLNGLRQIARTLIEPSSTSPAAGWLRRLSEVKNRRELWAEKGLTVAKSLIENADVIWSLLTWSDDSRRSDEWPALTAGAVERLRRELWPEAVQTLLDEAVRQHLRARERHVPAEEVDHGARR